MHTYQTILYRFLWIGLAAAILMGCGKGRPAEFKQTAGEMKEGPGVFTGEEGAFVVYDSDRGGALPRLCLGPFLVPGRAQECSVLGPPTRVTTCL